MEQKQKIEVGIEVKLDTPDSFLLVKETLTRLGIASTKTKTLFQSCHILHKGGRYFIVHFLELFLLDNKHAEISEEDYRRRNRIAKFLHDWKLCTVLNILDFEFMVSPDQIKIVSYKDKKDWNLIPKYQIGKKK